MIDEDDLSEDWIKTDTWDLPTEFDDFIAIAGGTKDAVRNWMDTHVAVVAMPDALRGEVQHWLDTVELEAKYDPDQPRDDAGRFGEGGGGIPNQDPAATQAALATVPGSEMDADAWVAEHGEVGRAYADLMADWSNTEGTQTPYEKGQAAVDGSTKEGRLLAGFMEHAPVIADPLYRGFHQDAEPDWKPGSTIELNPSSFSRDRDVALEYAGGFSSDEAQVMLTVEAGARGLPIDGLSSYGEEEREVVAGGRFEVTRAEMMDGIFEVGVRQK